MTQPSRSYALALLLVGACAASEGAKPAGGGGAPPAAAIEEFEFAPGYVGSAACASCHEKEHELWAESLHSRMEQPATPATVVGEFTREGTVLPLDAFGRRLVISFAARSAPSSSSPSASTRRATRPP